MSARFMEKLGLDVVILHERASEGATIIEKLEHYSHTDFAVVLLTGDDRGGSLKATPDAYQLRPRQNVVFELGYFVARLGRSRVCALYEQGVELPSDYQGVVFVEIDNRGAWRINLAKELKQAGLSVDLNKLF